jgi:hypothetical protein
MLSGRSFAAIGAVLVLAIFAASSASADIPRKINYQGRLLDKDTGEPLVGSHSLTFVLYEDCCSSTNPVWSESQTVTADSLGVISVILGATPIDISFDVPCWLEVQVDGEILSPRREIVSVPYAFRASDADLLDGNDADAFASSVHDHDDRYYTQGQLNIAGTINGGSNPVDWTKLKGVPAGFADDVDDVGPGDGFSLDASDGDPIDAVYVSAGGKVGVGTTAPERELHVKGFNPRILIEGNASNPEVNFKVTGDASSSVWAIYKHTSTGDLRFFQNGDRVTFEDGTGYVGIGVDDPLEELHVRGTGPTYLYAEAPAGYPSGVTLGVDGSPKWTMHYNPGNSEVAFMQTGVGNRVVFTDGGGVGIGTEPTLGVLEAAAISPGVAIFGNTGITGPISYGGGIGVKGLFSSDAVYGVGVMGEANVGSTMFSTAVGVYGKTNAGMGYGVFSEGGLGSTGSMTSIVETGRFGWRELYGVSSAENWFEDFGTAQLVGGTAEVGIDPVFAETADFTGPYHVFLTPLGDCGLYVAEKTAASFTVKAIDGVPADVGFDYRIVAKRRGYEEKRLGSADKAATFMHAMASPEAAR